MVYINNVSMNSRHNRPTVLSKTALITYFLNDGVYADPYEIHAVSIFNASSNFYPSSVIGSDSQVSAGASGLVLMNFANSSVNPGDTAFSETNYSSVNFSGIYKLRTGVYAVVLDSDNLVSSLFTLSSINQLGLNRVSAVGDYIDVWTVKRTNGSNLSTIINKFTLNADRFMSITEPLMFRVATRLENPYIILGSKVDLKFTNEFTIENTNIDESIVNLFKESFILDPAIEIYKENSDRNLASRVTVSGWSDTSSLCDVTSDNTVTMLFDTTLLPTHARMLDGTLGSQRGPYVARLKFNALNQVIYSNYFTFIVR